MVPYLLHEVFSTFFQCGSLMYMWIYSLCGTLLPVCFSLNGFSKSIAKYYLHGAYRFDDTLGVPKISISDRVSGFSIGLVVIASICLYKCKIFFFHGY